MIPTKDELLELTMRSFWTFVKVFLGGLTLAGSGLLDIDAAKVAAVAAAGSVLGLIQIYAAQKLDSRMLRGS